jgi:hypothetical protein
MSKEDPIIIGFLGPVSREVQKSLGLKLRIQEINGFSSQVFVLSTVSFLGGRPLYNETVSQCKVWGFWSWVPAICRRGNCPSPFPLVRAVLLRYFLHYWYLTLPPPKTTCCGLNPFNTILYGERGSLHLSLVQFVGSWQQQ